MTHVVHGAPPPDLVPVPDDAVQVSPLIPGSAAIEDLAAGSLDGLTLLAPRGTLDRRYVVAHGLRALKPGAPFTILAAKKLGGGRIGDELAAFGCVAEDRSKHHHRICTGRRPDALIGIDAAIADGAPRHLESLAAWTQPGVFSWDRLDPGSALLIANLPPLAGRGADLGCGIGLLARAVLAQPSVGHLTLIDIDRRAVAAARRNVDPARSNVIWADVRRRRGLPSDLDFVVMNPPFHDGGAEDQDLGRTFIARAAEALRPGGLCVLVANRHLPYEAALMERFADVRQQFQGDGFKVYVARK